jgi:3-hydroxybutyryl-CoA dehydrogenase
MTLADIKTIAVCGAGTMGAGIAQVFAQHQFKVVLFDLSTSALDKAKSQIHTQLEKAVEKQKISAAQQNEIINAIQFTSDINEVKGELVIEAIIEDLDIKQKLYKSIAAINCEETIFVSNTSSLSITAIAKSIDKPERVAGMHFFNPAHLMKLVEVIKTPFTAPSVLETLKELTLKIGKTPVFCLDSPGFIVNRVARHFYVESLVIAEEKIAPIEKIDSLLESAGFKMGAFKLMDTIGNDINFEVTNSLYKAFHQAGKFRPSRLQEQKVIAGHLGRKSGRGFYEY